MLSVTGFPNPNFLSGVLHASSFTKAHRQQTYVARGHMEWGDHLPINLVVANRLVRPNIAFKPKLHRYANNMADNACHVASYALQFGLT
jgi:hypothetical protein